MFHHITWVLIFMSGHTMTPLARYPDQASCERQASVIEHLYVIHPDTTFCIPQGGEPSE